MRDAKKAKPTRRLCAGFYIVNHSAGSCTVEFNKNNLWDVKEECTGELFATKKTKKRAMNFIADNFGM